MRSCSLWRRSCYCDVELECLLSCPAQVSKAPFGLAEVYAPLFVHIQSQAFRYGMVLAPLGNINYADWCVVAVHFLVFPLPRKQGQSWPERRGSCFKI